MAFTFEWDTRKAQENMNKHDISFEEAAGVFADALSIITEDPDHSEDEDRFIIIGQSHRNRTLVVVYTERKDNIRIISARLATRRETRTYEEGR